MALYFYGAEIYGSDRSLTRKINGICEAEHYIKEREEYHSLCRGIEENCNLKTDEFFILITLNRL